MFGRNLNKHNIPPRNSIVAAIDGAPAMVGYYRELSVILKERVPTVHTVRCVLYRQHL